MEEKLKELKRRLGEIYDLDRIDSLLGWDQQVYMPPGGGPARGRQSALIARLSQERASDPALGQLLEDLRSYEESLPYDSDEASLIRVARREYELRSKIPPAFMERFVTHIAQSFDTWVVARPENDFARVEPILEKTLDLSREVAGYFPGYDNLADPLIAFSDYGMSAESIRTLFAELRKQLVPLVEAITALPPADDSCLRQYFPEGKQLEFSKKVVEQLGYDFRRGRIDKTHHPFMTKFSLGDVRITTRYEEDFLGQALFSSIHESGHAMYEQGINPEYEGTPLAGGTSSGVHESQSRLWENVIGRSRGFWEYFFPVLKEAFPGQFDETSVDGLYRAANKVQKSLIRTEADEVTYNLHVMLRFDFELALLDGSLTIHDLPEAWHARYQEDMGMHAPDDRNGVLQDVHWFSGWIGGMFQGYTLGNILSAQFYDAALKAVPSIPQEIARGNFQPLHGWLTDNVYRPGSKFTTSELVERATGNPVKIEPYVDYLKNKYRDLYPQAGI